MKKAKLHYMRSIGHGLYDPDKPTRPEIQTHAHEFHFRDEDDSSLCSLDKDVAAELAEAAAARVAARATGGVVADLVAGLRWRMEVTVSRVAAVGCSFRARDASGELLPPGEGGRPERWPTGPGAPSYRTGATPRTPGADPWARGPSRWSRSLDWRPAASASASAASSAAGGALLAAASTASPATAFQSEKAEVRASVPDGRTALDPIVEVYLGPTAARVVRAVRSRARARNAGRAPTGARAPRTVAEAVDRWRRAEARRGAPPDRAARERGWRGAAGPAPLPSYDAPRDPHCTYALGTAFAASPRVRRRRRRRRTRTSRETPRRLGDLVARRALRSRRNRARHRSERGGREDAPPSGEGTRRRARRRGPGTATTSCARRASSTCPSGPRRRTRTATCPCCPARARRPTTRSARTRRRPRSRPAPPRAATARTRAP